MKIHASSQTMSGFSKKNRGIGAQIRILVVLKRHIKTYHGVGGLGGMGYVHNGVKELTW